VADEYFRPKPPQIWVVSHCTAEAKEGCATISPPVNMREDNVPSGASRTLPDIGKGWGTVREDRTDRTFRFVVLFVGSNATIGYKIQVETA